MGNYEHLDKERFVKNQGFLKEAAQYFSDCNIRMFGSGDHYDLQYMMNYYDGLGVVQAGVARFRDAQRRLIDLSDAMDAYLKEHGYVHDINENRLHHEIYMSDARKVAPEKWKTVIRHPVKKEVE